jgi:5-formyltetrahydrofolate cyclo-ligase
MSVDDPKAALRRRLLALRMDVSAARPDAGAALVEHWPEAWALPAGCVVAGYRALPGEIDPEPLMRHLASRGAELALPVTQAPDGPLLFLAWSPGDPLQRAAFGVEEPTGKAPARHPDLVLVPLLGVDRHGMRIGFGKGYYDRTLARLRTLAPVRAVGLAFSEQRLDSVPFDDHDQPLDALVTDSGFHLFGTDKPESGAGGRT